MQRSPHFPLGQTSGSYQQEGALSMRKFRRKTQDWIISMSPFTDIP